MTTQAPTKGKLLIAEPFMGDKNFDRSVVLLCEHNDRGTFGLVLNQSTNLTLGDVLENMYSEMPLFLGGPVEQNTLHFIHRLGQKIDGSIQVGEGIYWSGNFEEVRRLLNLGVIQATDIRLFIGYSGWGAGQLDKEMKQNTWIVTKTTAETLFETPTKELWRAILKEMGGDYKVLSNYPVDPRLN
jgi:putative transcriptional regulator